MPHPESRFRGLILGFYHQRNAGDDRLAAAFERWLPEHDLVFLPHTERPPESLATRFDYVVVGGGSVLDGNHGALSKLNAWTRRLGLPVFVISATICSLNERMLDELRAIATSPNRVWLRDHRSAGILNTSDTGSVNVAPDLTWLFPFTPQTPLPRDVTAIVNFRPWKGMDIDPSRWARLLGKHFPRSAPWPLCTGRDSDVPLSVAAVGGDSESGLPDFDPALAGRARLILAMRFHAIIFAVQAGTPFLAIENSKKVASLLYEIGLSWATLRPDCTEQEFLDQSARAREELTPERLREIAALQQSKAAAAAERFKAVITQSAATRRRDRNTISIRIRRRMRRLIPTLSL